MHDSFKTLQENHIYGESHVDTSSRYPLSLQPSEEEEIVELMLMKLCSLFGIKCKKQGGNHPNERTPASSNALSTISSGKIQ